MNILIKYHSWPVIIWCFFKNHLAFLCLNTESTPTKMVSMFLTFFNPSVFSCRVLRLIGVYFFVFYSFRLYESWKPDSFLYLHQYTVKFRK